jgi:GT2 family glycosyltransferase
MKIAPTGTLLKSGLVTPPQPNEILRSVDFVPGFSMLIPFKLLSVCKFDSSIRMYGEDLEFQLRLRELGQIAVSDSLALHHRQSPLNRDSMAQITFESDLFRWRLALEFPERVTKFRVLLATCILAFGQAIVGIFFRKPDLRYGAVGHLRFLISSKER